MLKELVLGFLLATSPASAQTLDLDPIGDIFRTFGVQPPAAPSLGGSRTPHVARGYVRQRKTVHGPAEPAVRQAARAEGVPEEIAVKAAAAESGNRCSAGSRYKGPLQIAPATARSLGYRGNGSDLNSCGAGLRWGMRHLALCFKQSRGNPLATLRCHRRGLGR